MDSVFEFEMEELQLWINSEEYKEDPNTSIDEKENITIASYIASYPTDQVDEDGETLDREIPLTVYIMEDKSYKIELDKGMFYLYYKGYETSKDIEVINNLLRYANRRGLLFGKLILLKADKNK